MGLSETNTHIEDSLDILEMADQIKIVIQLQCPKKIDKRVTWKKNSYIGYDLYNMLKGEYDKISKRGCPKKTMDKCIC